MLVACTSTLCDFENEVVPNFGSVHLVFVEEHPSNLVSGFGHLFVVLGEKSGLYPEQLLASPALNFSADTGEMGKGIKVGKYQLRRCHELLRSYSSLQDRSLLFVELNLSTTELTSLRRDLSARMELEYEYDFFRNNCGSALLSWLLPDGKLPTARLYQTPRQSFLDILSHRKARFGWSVRSDAEILRSYAAEMGKRERNHIRRALRNPTLIPRIQDLVARLLALEYLEGKQTEMSHSGLRQFREAIFAHGEGSKAAKSVIDLRRATPLDILSQEFFPLSEGPSFHLGAIQHSSRSQVGVSIRASAGLREYSTKPVMDHFLREVSLLGVQWDSYPDESAMAIDLAKIAIYQDFFSVFGVPSGGFSAGYTEIENSKTTSGLYVESWLGVSTRSRLGWFGVRGSFIADELEGSPNYRLLPGVSWMLNNSNVALEAQIHLNRDKQFGAEVKLYAHQDKGRGLELEWSQDSNAVQRTSLGYSIRF